MAHYIDKSAVVAEIEDWRDKIKKGIFSIPLTGSDRAYATFEYEILGKVRDFLDTLEVKDDVVSNDTITNSLEISRNGDSRIGGNDTLEVKKMDINKEISQFIDTNFGKATIGHKLSLRRIAKHFFELGLKASNPITAADRGTAEKIIINLKRVEKDYRIDLTREIEWLRNKVKKGY